MLPPSKRDARGIAAEAELLARAGVHGVPAAQSVRRRRVGYLVVGAFAVAGILVPGLLERFGAIHGGAPAAGILVGFVVWMALEWIPQGTRAVSHGQPDADLVTAMTLTGLRTVDLDRLDRVRRFRARGRNSWSDLIEVRDRSGVGFRFSDAELVDRVGAAVRRARATRDPSVPPVQVSPFAAVRLGLTPPPDSDERFRRAGVDVVVGVLVPFCVILFGTLVAWLVASA
ncbi:hypothetical protein GXW82_41835 [Streptacidiphilus sp. 4-A2]|nr:hypothetical protein [Streptacidiphilus sp. 4-A2]